MKIQNAFLPVLVLAVLVSGCGKEVKLSVKPAVSEVGQPTADLVRSVEVSYHNPSGREELRHSIPTLSLNQPMTVDQKFLKDVHWEKGGTWQAVGYASDGLALLAGSAQPDPDKTDVIELTLGKASDARMLFSPFLRRVRISAAGRVAEYSLSSYDLRRDSRAGRCTPLPVVVQVPEKGIIPTLIFESSIKAPTYSYELTALDGLPTGRNLQPVPIALSGEAALELGPKMMDGLLQKANQSFHLHLYSGPQNEYEGCLQVESLLKHDPLKPLALSFLGSHATALGGYGNIGYHSNTTSRLVIRNPNEIPLTVTVNGTAASVVTGKPLFPICGLNPGRIPMGLAREFSFNFVIAGGQEQVIWFLGASLPHQRALELSNVAVNWTVTTNPVIGENSSELSPQTRTDVIP